MFVGTFSVSVIHEEKFASRAFYVPLRSAHNRGLPDLLRLSLSNAQKYRHAKYACLILACLYPLASNLFFVNYWNLEKVTEPKAFFQAVCLCVHPLVAILRAQVTFLLVEP